MFETKIEEMFVDKLDLDFECMYDLMTDKGIIINQVESYNKKGEKNYHGLQSSFFGSDFSDDDAFTERWSCECKKYVGRAYEGKICEKCLKPVGYVDIDLTKFGWIVLHNFKVISPIYTAKLTDALGSSNGESILDKIITVKYDNRAKDKDYYLKEREDRERKNHPFIQKGLIWFKEHYDEVLDYYAKKKPAKKELFEELKMDKEKVFTSSIPVISSILRIELPGEKDKKHYKMRINTIYQAIIRCVNNVNELGSPESMHEEDIIVAGRYLATINKEIMNLFTEIFKLLDGKKGIIQGKTIAGRYNFSARNVIIPGSGYLHTDEIELCYISFMELFRYELINLYAKVNDCTIMSAQNEWKKALVRFDPLFYDLMEYIINRNSKYVNVVINRNPSINVGSFLAMKVIAVKPNIEDKTLTVPNTILKLIAGD